MAITESAKMDLLGTNIRVSSVSPGLVKTEFSKVRLHSGEYQAANVCKNMRTFSDMDITGLIVFRANRPPRVNILDTFFPTAQSSAILVSRKL